MEDELLNCGQGEGFKAGIHLGLFSLAVTCLAYNSLAWGQRGNWSERKEMHLLTSVAVYTALGTYEFIQMKRHWNNRQHYV